MSEPTIGYTQESLTTPNLPDLADKMGPLERKVAALDISDAESHRSALETGKRLRGMKAFVVDLFADSKKKAHELHKSITKKERSYLDPIEKTLSLLGAKLTAYERREQARAEEEARARQLAARKAEEERQIQEAITAEQAGDKDLAAAILEAPVEAPVVIAQPELAEVAGTSQRTTWSAEVQSLEMLVAYVAANPHDIELLLPNQVALNGLARAMKGNLRIPGVRAVPSVSRTFKAD